jgi:hypothetical protein
MASGSSGFTLIDGTVGGTAAEVQVNDTDVHGPLYAYFMRPFEETEEKEVQTRASCVIAARWGRLIRMLRRIRFLQRTWGLLGGFLQSQWPASLRNGIRDHM